MGYLWWKFKSQKGELQFHRRNTWRQMPEDSWKAQNREIFESILGALPDNGEIRYIDVGAGSRLRLSFLEASEVVAIEPLATKFLETIAWCDLEDATLLYSAPGEKFLAELSLTADFVFCINVIDHVYHWQVVVENLARYAKKGGKILISFDSHLELDDLHPIKISKDEVCKVMQVEGCSLIQEAAGKPYHPGLRGTKHDLVFLRD